jgi:hypothetical protein
VVKYTPNEGYATSTDTDALNTTPIMRTDFAFHAVNHKHDELGVNGTLGSDTELKIAELEAGWTELKQLLDLILNMPRARIFVMDLNITKKTDGANVRADSHNHDMVPKTLQGSVAAMMHDTNEHTAEIWEQLVGGRFEGAFPAPLESARPKYLTFLSTKFIRSSDIEKPDRIRHRVVRLSDSIKVQKNDSADSPANSGKLPSTSATGVVKWGPRTRKVEKWIDDHLTDNWKIGYSIRDVDGNIIDGYRDKFDVRLASVSKALIFGAALKKNNGPGSLKDDLVLMITKSDNAATSRVLTSIGDTYVENFVQTNLDISSFTLASHPGNSKMSARQISKAFAALPDAIPSAQRSFFYDTLASIIHPQQWGVIYAAKQAGWLWHTKGGWLDETGTAPGDEPGVVLQGGLYYPSGKRSSRISVAVVQEFPLVHLTTNDDEPTGALGRKATDALVTIGNLIFTGQE